MSKPCFFPLQLQDTRIKEKGKFLLREVGLGLEWLFADALNAFELL